jgi:scyllo-inositol 2-dehydrogenase (NADP+)
MSTESDINIAILGYGLAGAVFHAPLIAAVPGLRVSAVVTRDPERARAAAARFPGVRVVATADELWQHAPELDLVVIASPNRTHVHLAERALREGLAVVVDKPFAATAEEGRRVIDLARAEGRLLTVFQNRRWDGDFLTVRRLLDDGELGSPTRFESRFERWRPVAKPGWRQLPAPEDAGGVLYDLGAHLVDQALLLFGPVTAVYAEQDRRSPGLEVDDDSFLALTHASGVRSHLWMSTYAPLAGPRFRVLGSRAAFVKHGLDAQEAALREGGVPGGPDWGAEQPEAWGTLGAGEDAQRLPTEPGDYAAFYRGVLRALRTGAPPPVDPADSVSGLEIIEAARRSAGQGRVVTVG